MYVVALAAYVDLYQDFAGFFYFSGGRHEACLSYGFGIALVAFLINTIAMAIGIVATNLLPQALPKALQVFSAIENCGINLLSLIIKLILVCACVNYQIAHAQTGKSSCDREYECRLSFRPFFWRCNFFVVDLSFRIEFETVILFCSNN